MSIIKRIYPYSPSPNNLDAQSAAQMVAEQYAVIKESVDTQNTNIDASITAQNNSIANAIKSQDDYIKEHAIQGASIDNVTASINRIGNTDNVNIVFTFHLDNGTSFDSSNTVDMPLLKVSSIDCTSSKSINGDTLLVFKFTFSDGSEKTTNAVSIGTISNPLGEYTQSYNYHIGDMCYEEVLPEGYREMGVCIKNHNSTAHSMADAPDCWVLYATSPKRKYNYRGLLDPDTEVKEGDIFISSPDYNRAPTLPLPKARLYLSLKDFVQNYYTITENDAELLAELPPAITSNKQPLNIVAGLWENDNDTQNLLTNIYKIQFNRLIIVADLYKNNAKIYEDVYIDAVRNMATMYGQYDLICGIGFGLAVQPCVFKFIASNSDGYQFELKNTVTNEITYGKWKTGYIDAYYYGELS